MKKQKLLEINITTIKYGTFEFINIARQYIASAEAYYMAHQKVSDELFNYLVDIGALFSVRRAFYKDEQIFEEYKIYAVEIEKYCKYPEPDFLIDLKKELNFFIPVMNDFISLTKIDPIKLQEESYSATERIANQYIELWGGETFKRMVTQSFYEQA